MKKDGYYILLTIASTIGAITARLLGGWDSPLQTLCCVMAVDYITGVICALVWHKSPKTQNGAFDSKASVKGLFKKMAILACVFLSYQIEILTGGDFIRNGTILFFVANDGFSIIENLGIMGIPMPKVLKNAFEQLKEKQEVA